MVGRCRHLPHRWSTWPGSAPRAGSACRSSALALEGESSPELDGQALADHGLGRGGLRALEGRVNALLAWPECCRACSIGQMLGRPPRSPCRGVVSHNFLLQLCLYLSVLPIAFSRITLKKFRRLFKNEVNVKICPKITSFNFSLDI